jgi:hypothetical protein
LPELPATKPGEEQPKAGASQATTTSAPTQETITAAAYQLKNGKVINTGAFHDGSYTAQFDVCGRADST